MLLLVLLCPSTLSPAIRDLDDEAPVPIINKGLVTPSKAKERAAFTSYLSRIESHYEGPMYTM